MSRSTWIVFISIIISAGPASPELIMGQTRLGSPVPEGTFTCLSSKKGILYSGIDNYIAIDSALVAQSDNIEIKSTMGNALIDTLNRMLIIPPRPGKIRLNITCTKDLDTLLSGYQYYMVQSIPEPKLMLDDMPINTPIDFQKQRLLAIDSLGVYFSDDIIGSSNWMVVKEFQLGYNYGGFYVSHLNEGNKLSLTTKAIIYKLGPDHEITIRPTLESQGNIEKQLPIIYRIRLY